MYNLAVLFSLLLLVRQFCLHHVASICKEVDVTFFKFSSAEGGSPRAGGPSKTCLVVPSRFRVASCN